MDLFWVAFYAQRTCLFGSRYLSECSHVGNGLFPRREWHVSAGVSPCFRHRNKSQNGVLLNEGAELKGRKCRFLGMKVPFPRGGSAAFSG